MMKNILTCLLLTGSIICNAQMVNTGNLQLHNGSNLSILGNFDNQSPANLLNNGTLHLKGSITNAQPVMTAGTGTVRMDGSAQQIINGTAVFRCNNLVTNNTNGFLLQNSVGITGIHSFTNGIITTTGNNYVHYETGASYTGSQDNRHVNGLVKKSGTTDFNFPVGNGTVERKIALQNLTATSEFDVQHRVNTPAKTQFTSPFIAVDSFEYWTVNKVTGGAADVVMNWDNSKIAFPSWPVSGIRVAGFNGSNWINQGGTGSGSTTAGTITATGISAFNSFTFGLVSATMPLVLIDFNARHMAGHTLLDWQTMQERNVSHFVVERSDNGLDYYAIGNIKAKNLDGTHHYEVKDHKAIQQKAWYRLRMIDMDTREQLSKTIVVSAHAITPHISLKTNPIAGQQIVLTSNTTRELYFNYRLTTGNGQLLKSGQLLLRNGDNIIQAPGMKPGYYFLYMENGSGSQRFKLYVR